MKLWKLGNYKITRRREPKRTQKPQEKVEQLHMEVDWLKRKGVLFLALKKRFYKYITDKSYWISIPMGFLFMDIL